MLKIILLNRMSHLDVCVEAETSMRFGCRGHCGSSHLGAHGVGSAWALEWEEVHLFFTRENWRLLSHLKKASK